MKTALDVRKVIVGAFALPWRMRNAFAHHLVVPFVSLVVLGIVQTLPLEFLPMPALFVLATLHTLAFVVFAVICHRLVLLAPGEQNLKLMPRWTRRETRFLLLFAVIWLMGMALGFACVAAITYGTITSSWYLASPPSEVLFFVVVPLLLLPTYYVLARFSLVLPATALDRKVGLRWAWQASSGNSWRLFVVVGILPWAFLAPTFVIDYSTIDAVTTVAVTVAGTVLLPVEIAALSLAYRELTVNDPPTPGHSPASPQTA